MTRIIILAALLSGCSTTVVWEEKNGVRLPHLKSESLHFKVRLDRFVVEWRDKF